MTREDRMRRALELCVTTLQECHRVLCGDTSFGGPWHSGRVRAETQSLIRNAVDSGMEAISAAPEAPQVGNAQGDEAGMRDALGKAAIVAQSMLELIDDISPKLTLRNPSDDFASTIEGCRSGLISLIDELKSFSVAPEARHPASASVEKVVRDGKVAVLFSPGFGAGWSAWVSDEYKELFLFHPKIVDMVESGREMEIDEDWMAENMGIDDVYCGGRRNLQIEWLPVGTAFKVSEYDGSESIETMDDLIHIA